MTVEELSLKLGKSESTLLHNFKRTKANLEKKGIIINKIGKGKNAEYTLEYRKKE